MTASVAIIGAGLAGAACANAFALAGFAVTVFEQGAAPASGASGAPLAMFAPSVSADDAPHSRLLRRGVQLLTDELQRLSLDERLIEGVDWALTGVLERCLRADKKIPNQWLEPQDPLPLQSRVLAKPSAERPTELFHGAAGWVRPDRLIAAWLAHTRIKIETHAHITQLADARLVAHDVVIVACGSQTPLLLPHFQMALQPIRGQVEWGISTHASQPINGMGHWIEGSGRWLAGATFQRDEFDLKSRVKDASLNFEKLAVLRPELAKTEIARLRKASSSWVGVRIAQKNRAPLVESIISDQHTNVWICTALGSRGLSLASLCAAQLVANFE